MGVFCPKCMEPFCQCKFANTLLVFWCHPNVFQPNCVWPKDSWLFGPKNTVNKHTFSLFAVVIYMSFDQAVFNQNVLGHLANSVYKEYLRLLLTNWSRWVSLVINVQCQFADMVCQYTFGLLVLSSKSLSTKLFSTKRCLTICPTQYIKKLLVSYWPISWDGCLLSKMHGANLWLRLPTHFWFIGAVIQMSFDQVVFDQKALDHLADNVNKEKFSILFTSWLRDTFVQNAWSQFADMVYQHTLGLLVLSSKCLLTKLFLTKRRLTIWPTQYIKNILFFCWPVDWDGCLLSKMYGAI